MKDIPIIFSAPMVLALLDGRKTMTRRLAWQKPHKAAIVGCDFASEELEDFDVRGWNVKSRGGMTYVSNSTPWQRVKPGDRLWVRESLQSFQREPRATAQYVADITGVPHRGVAEGWCDGRAYWQWNKRSLPSIHMPRWASRLTLVVTATKIERLNQILDHDAILEGATSRPNCSGYRDEFEGWSMDWSEVGTIGPLGKPLREQDICLGAAHLAFGNYWCRLHGKQSWYATPEVVALTFTVHKQNIDTLPKADAA